MGQAKTIGKFYPFKFYTSWYRKPPEFNSLLGWREVELAGREVAALLDPDAGSSHDFAKRLPLIPITPI
jgi:hypothetical protein